MALLQKNFNVGDLQGTIYEFEVVGDILPMHRHSRATSHIAICLRGSVVWRRPGKPDVIQDTGAVLDFSDDCEHEAEARIAGSKLLHIQKYIK